MGDWVSNLELRIFLPDESGVSDRVGRRSMGRLGSDWMGLVVIGWILSILVDNGCGNGSMD